VGLGISLLKNRKNHKKLKKVSIEKRFGPHKHSWDGFLGLPQPLFLVYTPGIEPEGRGRWG